MSSLPSRRGQTAISIGSNGQDPVRTERSSSRSAPSIASSQLYVPRGERPPDGHVIGVERTGRLGGTVLVWAWRYDLAPPCVAEMSSLLIPHSLMRMAQLYDDGVVVDAEHPRPTWNLNERAGTWSDIFAENATVMTIEDYNTMRRRCGLGESSMTRRRAPSPTRSADTASSNERPSSGSSLLLNENANDPRGLGAALEAAAMSASLLVPRLPPTPIPWRPQGASPGLPLGSDLNRLVDGGSRPCVFFMVYSKIHLPSGIKYPLAAMQLRGITSEGQLDPHGSYIIRADWDLVVPYSKNFAIGKTRRGAVWISFDRPAENASDGGRPVYERFRIEGFEYKGGVFWERPERKVLVTGPDGIRTRIEQHFPRKFSRFSFEPPSYEPTSE